MLRSTAAIANVRSSSSIATAKLDPQLTLHAEHRLTAGLESGQKAPLSASHSDRNKAAGWGGLSTLGRAARLSHRSVLALNLAVLQGAKCVWGIEPQFGPTLLGRQASPPRGTGGDGPLPFATAYEAVARSIARQGL